MDNVIDFIQNHVVWHSTKLDYQPRYGLRRPKSDKYANELGMKLLTSTPYHAQANGQVEATNKIIIGMIKKHIGRKPKSWHKTLDQVLWAYQNFPRESIRVTPL